MLLLSACTNVEHTVVEGITTQEGITDQEGSSTHGDNGDPTDNAGQIRVTHIDDFFRQDGNRVGMTEKTK